MKKFAVYEWRSDDEGGFGICRAEQFSPLCGSFARPSQKIGEFNTVEGLAEILFDSCSDDYASLEEVTANAEELFDDYDFFKK